MCRVVAVRCWDSNWLGDECRLSIAESDYVNSRAADRVINNTMTCIGPWLACFEQQPPELAWAVLPADWISEGGVPLKIAKGTLVPAHAQPENKKRKMTSSDEVSDAQTSDSGARLERVLTHGSDRDVNESSDGLSGGSGRLHSSSSSPVPAALPFVDRYVEAQRRMCALVEEHLAQADEMGMPESERAHLMRQLDVSRTILAAADQEELVRWRSRQDALRYPYRRLGAQAPVTGRQGEVVANVEPLSPCLEDEGGSAAGLRVLAVASDQGLERPCLEACVSVALLSGGGAECTMAIEGSVSRLDEMLDDVHVLLFCGHADLKVGGCRTLAFSSAGEAEAIDAEALTRVVSRHRDSLRLVLLNGCESLHLALRLAHAGVAAVACWSSKVADEAA